MPYETYRTETVETRPRRSHAQQSRRDRPDYEYAESYDSRDGPRSARHAELVRRREDSDISVEEVERDFPPGSYYDRRAPRRARSLERGRGGASQYDYYGDGRYSANDLVDERSGRSVKKEEKHKRGRSLSRGHELAAAAAGAGLAVGGKELWDRRGGGKDRHRSRSRVQQAALGVAGAVAGDLAVRQFGKFRAKSKSRERHSVYEEADDRGGRYYSEEVERPKPSRRKSISEAALAALGVGAAAGGGHDDRHRGRDRQRHGHRRGSSSSFSSRSSSSGYRQNRSRSRKAQAAKSALTAAAAEAWKSRKDPGGFFEGERARRVMTAAAGAGGIDALIDRDPDHHSKRHTAEGAIGGLLLNRFVNGSRREVEERSRSRSRGARSDRGGGRGGRSKSRAREAIKDLGIAGIAAGAAKKFLDSKSSRSRSRSRGRGRRYSSGSDDYSPERHAPRARSRSVSQAVNRGLSKLGLRHDPDHEARRAVRRGNPESHAQNLPRGGAGGGRSRSVGGASSGSDTESEFSLSEEEANRRKMKGKEILTAGLATVATIHAAHGVYGSMNARDARTKAVIEGKMSEDEARKAKKKALFQDTAAVGLAALGVKGAYSEWKEAGKERREFREMEEKVARHRRIQARRNVRANGGGGGGGGGGGDSGANSWRNSAPDLSNSSGRSHGGGGGGGPVYADGNPYASGGGGGYDDRRQYR